MSAESRLLYVEHPCVSDALYTEPPVYSHSQVSPLTPPEICSLPPSQISAEMFKHVTKGGEEVIRENKNLICGKI